MDNPTGGASATSATVRTSLKAQVRRFGPKLTLGAADTAAIVTSMVVAFVIRDLFASDDHHHEANALVGVLSLPIWLAAFSRHRLYSARYLVRRVEELRRVGRAILLGIVGMAAVGFMLQLQASRAWLGLTAAVAFVVVAIEREAARHLFGRLRRGGGLLRPVVVVGVNHEAREIAALMATDPDLGYRLAGFVTDLPPERVHPSIADQVLGTVSDVRKVVEEVGAVGVIVAATSTTLDVSNRLVRELTNAGIHVELSSALRDVAVSRLTVRPFGRFPVIYVEPVRRTGWRTVAKRSFDVAFSLCGLVAAALLMAVVAVAVRLDSPGPVLFRQVRVGRDGVTFRVLKFRTMEDGAEHKIIDLRDRNEASGPLFKIADDPRVTRVGRLLRRTSIDELPQLWNVVRGEMSLVGPRPALPSEVDKWHPELHERLRVKPGMTGMWQVNGRSTTSWDDYVRLDLYYVDNWSLSTDLAILAKTVPAVLTSRGAS
jgi:exopolysaccharide biosynthesis polyprenyl glycosylphosphotransferase